jgi:hypothetical protein
VEYQHLALRMRCGSSLPEHTLLTVTHSNSTEDNINNSSSSSSSNNNRRSSTSEEEDPDDSAVTAATVVTTTNILNAPLPTYPITLVSSPPDNNTLEVSTVVVHVLYPAYWCRTIGL